MNNRLPLPVTEKVKYIIMDLKKFNKSGRDKNILEDQVACTISIDEQIGRMVLSHLEGKNEGMLEGAAQAKLEAAEAFLRDGLTVERVVRVLKLPIEQVQAIADKIATEKN